ncbi:MAG TPA: glycosyltransferase [Bryobacteraceae bacterium]|jgi:glycosyltransferase involved in cell wall biosynthesis
MQCSVLLPVYNAGGLLAETIESILSQVERDFEFLIIDDCSSDRSAEVIRGYAHSDSRIRAIFHERNAGLAETLNEGLREARAELVARIDQDDIALRDRLTTQLRFLRTRPELAVAGSFVYHMGRTPAHDRLVLLPVDHEEIAAELERRNCIYHPSVMMRRAPILALGGYRGAFRNSEDYDLWLRVSRVHRLANIPVPLLRYRFSTGGMSLGKKWQQMFFTEMALLSYRHPEWSGPQLEAETAAAVGKIDKRKFLDGVARGTIRELIGLGLQRDAWTVVKSFARQLGPLGGGRLFVSAAPLLLASSRRNRAAPEPG